MSLEKLVRTLSRMWQLPQIMKISKKWVSALDLASNAQYDSALICLSSAIELEKKISPTRTFSSIEFVLLEAHLLSQLGKFEKSLNDFVEVLKRVENQKNWNKFERQYIACYASIGYIKALSHLPFSSVFSQYEEFLYFNKNIKYHFSVRSSLKVQFPFHYDEKDFGIPSKWREKNSQ